MKKFTCLNLVFLIFLTTNILHAQQNLTLYQSVLTPQRNYCNPSFIPYKKVNIGLPVLSSTYMNLGNSGFKYSDLILKGPDDSLYVDFNNMLGKLSKNNYLTFALQLDLFNFGIQVKKNYFSLNAVEKANLRFRYPKDFMEFLWKGNGVSLGQNLDFNIGLDLLHYREYGFGYARQINEALTVGTKLKYLYGMENVWTEKADVTLFTDPNDFSITARSDIKVNSAGVDSASTGDINIGNYLFGKKNAGIGLDLGATYILSDKLSFSASILDIGMINWKTGIKNYESVNPGGSFTYSGIDINDYLKDSTALDKILDSLKNAFDVRSTYTSYRTSLPMQLYLGGSYTITKNHKAGILAYSQFFDKQIHPAVSLSYTLNIKNWFEGMVNYSVLNKSYNNVGFGLAFNAGPVHYHVISDNILGIFLPQNSKNINVRTGIVFTFGRPARDQDKDQDGIPDKTDDCAEVPGKAFSKGCPDMDSDGVPDKDDACPTDLGLVTQKGCPDEDGDAVINSKDSCQGTPLGIKVDITGCPIDTDKDGVADYKDKQPNTPSGVAVDNNGVQEDQQFIRYLEEEEPELKLEMNDSTISSDKPDSVAVIENKQEDVKPIVKSPAIFKIQLGVYKDEPPATLKTKFNELENIHKEKTSAGLNRYVIGNFKSYEAANKFKNELIKKGFSGIFVIAYRDGVLIPIKEALD